MKRLQQFRLFPTMDEPDCLYKAPWRDRKFYLLDGMGNKVIFVDENYLPEQFGWNEKDGPPSFLLPTAEYVCYLARESQQTNRPFPFAFYGEENKVFIPGSGEISWGHVEVNMRKADPRTIDLRWIEVVERLNGNPFEGNVREVEKDLRKVENSDIYLQTLPLEAWEVVIKYINGLDFLNCLDAFKTIEGVEKVMWDALNAHIIKTKDFWATTANCIDNQTFNEIVCSYYNIINEQRREKDETDSEQKRQCCDDSTGVTLQEICFAAHYLIEKLSAGGVRLKSMDALEKKIKHTLTFYEKSICKNGAFQWDNPKVTVGTNGTISYFSICSRVCANLFLLEGLDDCVERHRTVICSKNIYFVENIYLPASIIDQESELKSMSAELPKIERLAISSCDDCTHIRPLQGGLSGNKYSHPSSGKQWYFHRMEPVIACLGDVMAIWHEPTVLEFHKIIKENGESYNTNCFQSVRIENGYQYWNLQSNYTQFFIPVLKKVSNTAENNWDDFNIRQFYGERQLSNDYYELKLVNMRYGTDIIGIKNQYKVVNGNQPEIRFHVEHQFPEYYYYNAKKYRSRLDACYCGCQGHGMYMFWNHVALSISWCGVKWLFCSWIKALGSLKRGDMNYAEEERIQVTQACFCSPTILAAIINENLILFHIKKSQENEILHHPKGEPKLILENFRMIVTDLFEKGLHIEQMTFSFDKGEPYFFWVIRDTTSNSVLDFYLKRCCFSFQDGCEQSNIPSNSFNEPYFQLTETNVIEAEKIELGSRHSFTQNIQNPNKKVSNHPEEEKKLNRIKQTLGHLPIEENWIPPELIANPKIFDLESNPLLRKMCKLIPSNISKPPKPPVSEYPGMRPG